MSIKIKIDDIPIDGVSGSKRTNIKRGNLGRDWFWGFGKDEFCVLEGTWWDMVCLARNILASENTRIAAPEFYHPEFKNDNYCGEECPYEVMGDG